MHILNTYCTIHARMHVHTYILPMAVKDTVNKSASMDSAYSNTKRTCIAYVRLQVSASNGRNKLIEGRLNALVHISWIKNKGMYHTQCKGTASTGMVGETTLALQPYYYFSANTYTTCWANHRHYHPEPDCCTRTVLSSLGDGHSILLTKTSDRLTNHPSKRQKSHKQLFRPDCGSSVWRTDGCVVMTGCLCTYPPPVQTLVVQQRQTGRLQSTDWR